MARSRRWSRWLFSILLLVLVGGTIVLRVKRHDFEPPEAVRGSVMRVRNSFVDLYAARAGEHILLFDAGTDPEGKALDALLAAMKAKREDVSDVFMTHGHGDHVGAAPLCTRAKLHAGAADADVIAGKTGQAPTFARPLAWILPAPHFAVTDAIGGSGRVEIAVGGGPPVVALPMPGHTPGSYAFLYEGVLFAGDSLQYEGGKLEGAPSPFSVDMAANRRSIAGLSAALGGAKVETICTGHGGCTPPADTGRLLADAMERAKQ